LLIINKNIDIIKIKNKLNKLMEIYEINICSFDINLSDKLYNNIIHIYTYSNLSFYTYEYDILNDTIKLESRYCSFNNYNELYIFLSTYNDLEFSNLQLNCDINKIINELKDIAPECKTINFHHKYYNDSFGIYLINNNFKYLDNFLKKYKYKEIYNKKLFEKLNFDLTLNYDYNGNINGTGFFDFF